MVKADRFSNLPLTHFQSITKSRIIDKLEIAPYSQLQFICNNRYFCKGKAQC
jgi:hypothetical protein